MHVFLQQTYSYVLTTNPLIHTYSKHCHHLRCPMPMSASLLSLSLPVSITIPLCLSASLFSALCLSVSFSISISDSGSDRFIQTLSQRWRQQPPPSLPSPRAPRSLLSPLHRPTSGVHTSTLRKQRAEAEEGTWPQNWGMEEDEAAVAVFVGSWA